MSALVLLPGAGQAVHIGGLGVVFKLFGPDTGGRLAVVEHPIAPGTLAGPPHTHHREDEASYVLEGEVTVQLGDQIIQAKAGTLVFKPQGVQHTFWNQTSAPARLLEIITPAGFERYFQEAAALIPASGPPDVGQLMALAQRYELELDMSRVMELSETYHLRLG